MSTTYYNDKYEQTRIGTHEVGYERRPCLSNDRQVRMLYFWARMNWGNNLKPLQKFTFEEAMELRDQYPTEWGEYVTAHPET